RVTLAVLHSCGHQITHTSTLAAYAALVKTRLSLSFGSWALGVLLRREAFATPRTIWLACVPAAIVQPTHAALPELDFFRADPVTAPPVGPWNLTIREAVRRSLERGVEY